MLDRVGSLAAAMEIVFEGKDLMMNPNDADALSSEVFIGRGQCHDVGR